MVLRGISTKYVFLSAGNFLSKSFSMLLVFLRDCPSRRSLPVVRFCVISFTCLQLHCHFLVAHDLRKLPVFYSLKFVCELKVMGKLLGSGQRYRHL